MFRTYGVYLELFNVGKDSLIVSNDKHYENKKKTD